MKWMDMGSDKFRAVKKTRVDMLVGDGVRSD